MTVQRCVCLHGHFYQPPRENPWLEAVGIEESAHPYRNWNERITAECYAPNAAAPILGEQGRVARRLSNYARISFNVGPTLLQWLETEAAETYRAILDADRESRERYRGHGSAIAQAYNHTILPLANRRDKRTQVIWGIRDFQHRFARAPEGMWLPETAVDLDALDVLAEAGIQFTILAPHQARRWRRAGERSWHKLDHGSIDTRRPYRQWLPSGRSIVLFFYEGDIAQAIAFGGLLHSGEALVQRLLSAFRDASDSPQLVHVACDGETYGHHHRHGEMALAYALDRIEAGGAARLTNYGEFLERHPPTYEVEIRESTSWSCVHGVERWRSDCGCHTGGEPGWSQAWRAPLRQALDWLHDQLAPRFEAEGAKLLRDPWAARDGYISVILERAAERIDAFLAEHAAQPLDPRKRVRALQLLEMQRHAMLMYTSCGWFFHDLGGLETVQVLKYAARAIELAQRVFDLDFEPGFLSRVARARSNRKSMGDGRQIYLRRVKPLAVDLERIAGHYALSCLAAPCPERAQIHAYGVQRLDQQLLRRDAAELLLGVVRVTSRLTLESETFTYGMFQLEDRASAAIRPYPGPDPHAATVRGIVNAFGRGDLATAARLFEWDIAGPGRRLRALPAEAREPVAAAG